MVEEFFKEIVEVGIRVQGPEGIGKSFSLVNLVLYLKSTGKIHLVTCRSGLRQMDEPVLVYEMICHSIGMDLSDLGMEWNMETNHDAQSYNPQGVCREDL